MKKLITLFTLFAALQGAQARSIVSTVLHYENRAKMPGGVTHMLDVYTTGQVVHVTRSAQLPLAPGQEVTRLTRLQMARINSLVRRSTPVMTRFEFSAAMCFAPSSHVQKYTAMNDTIFLREGAICDGGFRVNVAPAAKKLVGILNYLERAAHDRPSFADIESQMDSMLE